jgi:hypothetical protein
MDQRWCSRTKDPCSSEDARSKDREIANAHVRGAAEKNLVQPVYRIHLHFDIAWSLILSMQATEDVNNVKTIITSVRNSGRAHAHANGRM